MDITIVGSLRWLDADAATVFEHWRQHGMAYLPERVVADLREGDLLFFWSRADRMLLGTGIASRGADAEPGGRPMIKAQRGYSRVPVIWSRSYSTDQGYAPTWGRTLPAFVPLEPAAAEDALDWVGEFTPESDREPYIRIAEYRVERAVREEILSTLESDRPLRQAWARWWAVGRADSDAMRVPERPGDASTAQLSTFYAAEVLEPLRWIRETARRFRYLEELDGLVIDSEPGVFREIDFPRLVADYWRRGPGDNLEFLMQTMARKG